MPHDKRLPPDDPRAWLNRACSNLVRAGKKSEQVYLEDLCFDAQQAAEKAIKAYCVSLDLDFPYVHDLAELITLLQQSGVDVPGKVQQAGRLTRYAVDTRYPGLAEPVTEEEHEEAVALAERTVQWAERQVRSGTDDTEAADA